MIHQDKDPAFVPHKNIAYSEEQPSNVLWEPLLPSGYTIALKINFSQLRTGWVRASLGLPNCM
jgi:hypothetical protein